MKGVASTALTTDSDFGPAMRRLTISEQMFVCNLFTNYKSITKAAELAGYTGASRNALHIQAHRLLRKPEISEAVKEESKRRTTFLLPKAQRALERLIESPEHQDHYKAIKAVRDDGGVSRAVERVLTVNVNNVTDQEKLDKLRAFAVAHGYDPEKFMGRTIEDAEFSEISSADDAENEDRELGII